MIIHLLRATLDEWPTAPILDEAPVRIDADTKATEGDSVPTWFIQFLNDRQTRKPSAHTVKAYHQDFVAIATLLTSG